MPRESIISREDFLKGKKDLSKNSFQLIKHQFLRVIKQRDYNFIKESMSEMFKKEESLNRYNAFNKVNNRSN